MEESVLKGFGVSATLLAGYLFLRFSPYRRFLAEHLRTDRFALHVLTFALSTYFVGVVIASFIEREFENGWIHSALLTAVSYTHLQAPVICALLAAPLLGLGDRICIAILMRRDPWVVQRTWKQPFLKTRTAAVARFIMKCDDAATRLLHRATVYRKPIMLSLKSGKVYVGEPVGGVGDPSVRAQSIKIIPRFSGYRDPETHKVDLRTNYTDIHKMMVPREEEEPSNPEDPLAKDLADLKVGDGPSVEVDMQDMGVVVLWSEVQSLSIYDDDIYRAFQNVTPPETGRLKLLGKDGLLTRLFS